MSIVRVRRGEADSRTGDPADDTPDRLTLTEAFVAPRSSSDIDDRGRTGVIVGLSLFGAYGADVRHTDQFEIDLPGYDEPVLFEVDGDPGHWKNPWTGWEAGCEIALKRAAG